MFGENSDNLLCIVVHQCGNEWINYSQTTSLSAIERKRGWHIFKFPASWPYSKAYYDNKHWSQQDKDQKVHIFTKLRSDEFEIAKKRSLSRWFFLQERMYQVLSKTVTHGKDAKQLSPDLFLLWNVPYPVRVGVSVVYINYCYVKIRYFF